MFLGGVDVDLFRSMFGIDHARLREGGQEILRGVGRIGELLFGAGAGVAGLQQLQGELRTAMEGLFKPGGSKPLINQ